MEFQRYFDGVGLIVQNKINTAFSSCPFCNERVQWEIVFDFKGDMICVLAKCPHCGGIVKTIFDFANNQPISTFTVAEVGSENRNHLEQGINYSLPSSSVAQSYGMQNATAPQSNKSEDSGSAGWGVLGFFIPIAGFILWLIWKDDKPKSSKSAGIGCLVSICLSVVMVILYVVIFVSIIGGIAGGVEARAQALINLLAFA